MRRISVLTMAVTLMLIGTGTVFAGGYSGDIGIGLSAVESSPVITGRFWTSDRMTLDPALGIIHIKPSKGDGATRWLPGLGLYAHLRPGDELRPYLGLRFDLDIASGGGTTLVDVIFGPAFGMEYFLSDQFSIGGEYQLRVVMTDGDGSPSFLLADATYITTAARLGVHFYF